ncbi:hypothetical protein CDES_13930 [Corynebacterium deserti GIMN1.010]|uniref:Uncharacterized protein n=1 Tax=Corynebacterium deserti GIMN1.010 TaxID=931089 RepID=A0A0M5IGN8_9CORY|nr:hypothetical protein CDES_13930 [Corynebacterium deserti GIMN1.010]
MQYLSTLACADTRDSRGAGIAIDAQGLNLFASNRSGAGDHLPPGPGNDSIARFSIQEDGLLNIKDIVEVTGQRPRFIGFNTQDELIVALEKSAQIHMISMGSSPVESSTDSHREQVLAEIESPVCVIFRDL